ncbi:MAG: DUF4333 domain-containing protein, partial [Pseudonocardia sp.]
MFSIVDRRRTATGIGLAGLLLLALTGCSLSVEPPAVEEQIRTQLGADSASCPDALPGEVGRTVTCSATAGPDTVDVLATVTSVAGSNVNFFVTGILNRPIVEEQIRTTFTADSATCPSSLAAKVGAKITCSATRGGETSDIVATVTSVEGGNAKFDLTPVGGAAPAGDSVPGQAVAQAVLDQLPARARSPTTRRPSPAPPRRAVSGGRRWCPRRRSPGPPLDGPAAPDLRRGGGIEVQHARPRRARVTGAGRGAR